MRGLPIPTNEENIEFNAKTEHGVPFKWVHISKVKGHGAMSTHNINKTEVAGLHPTTESNLRTALGVEICKLCIIARI